MLRQVMVPSKENSTISIPAEFYGTEIEASQNSNDINDIFEKHLYSFGNFKFNRNDANN